MIPHAPLRETCAVGALMVAMVLAALGSLPVLALGATQLLAAGLGATVWSAVALTAVTLRADKEEGLALAIPADQA